MGSTFNKLRCFKEKKNEAKSPSLNFLLKTWFIPQQCRPHNSFLITWYERSKNPSVRRRALFIKNGTPATTWRLALALSCRRYVPPTYSQTQTQHTCLHVRAQINTFMAVYNQTHVNVSMHVCIHVDRHANTQTCTPKRLDIHTNKHTHTCTRTYRQTQTYRSV